MRKKKKLTQKERIKLIESVIGKVPWSKFEPGVYNYCDRWCEKCKKKEKCFNYWSIQKEEAGLAAAEINQPLDVGIKSVQKSLTQTGNLLKTISEAEGIDLTMSPEEKAEYEKRERLTDHRREPIYLKAHQLFLEIYHWLNEMPSLDIKIYREAYDNLGWHYFIIDRKIARAVWGKKEAELEEDEAKNFSLDDSKKSAWVAYRSTKICAEALELMDQYVRDFRIGPMAEKCRALLNDINNELL